MGIEPTCSVLETLAQPLSQGRSIETNKKTKIEAKYKANFYLQLQLFAKKFFHSYTNFIDQYLIIF